MGFVCLLINDGTFVSITFTSFFSWGSDWMELYEGSNVGVVVSSSILYISYAYEPKNKQKKVPYDTIKLTGWTFVPNSTLACFVQVPNLEWMLVYLVCPSRQRRIDPLIV